MLYQLSYASPDSACADSLRTHCCVGRREGTALKISHEKATRNWGSFGGSGEFSVVELCRIRGILRLCGAGGSGGAVVRIRFAQKQQVPPLRAPCGCAPVGMTTRNQKQLQGPSLCSATVSICQASYGKDGAGASENAEAFSAFPQLRRLRVRVRPVVALHGSRWRQAARPCADGHRGL
jgi:hypothetical protein